MDLFHGLAEAIERQGAGALRRLLLIFTIAAIDVEWVVPASPLLCGAADVMFDMDDAHLATILHANSGLLVIFLCKNEEKMLHVHAYKHIPRLGRKKPCFEIL